MNKGATWFVGWAGTWFLLTLLSESTSTADLASALAVSIAITVTFAQGRDAVKELQRLGISLPAS